MNKPTSPTKRLRLLAALLLCTVFLCGMLCGALVMRKMPPPPKQVEAAFLPQPVDEALSLSPHQRRQARAIAESYRPEIQAIRRELQPRLSQIHTRMQKDLRAILDAEQRQKFDALLEKKHRRR